MSNAPEAPDTAGLLRYLRTFSRVSRARRLTTRRTATYAHIWDCFEKTQPFLIHASKLAKEGTLEMLFEETRITDVYLDLILEDDFFMEQQGYVMSVLSGYMCVVVLSHGRNFKYTIERMLRWATSLWKHIWDNHRLLCLDVNFRESFQPQPGADGGVGWGSEPLIMLLSSYAALIFDKTCPGGLQLDAARYLQLMALYVWLHLAADIDMTTPKGLSLRSILGCIRPASIATNEERDALVQELFREGSNLKINACIPRFDQQLQLVQSLFRGSSSIAWMQLDVQILIFLQKILVHPRAYWTVAKFGCHKALTQVMEEILRSDFSAHIEYVHALWNVCRNLFLETYDHIFAGGSGHQEFSAICECFRGQDVVQVLAMGINLLARFGTNFGPEYQTYPPQHKLQSQLVMDIEGFLYLVLDMRRDSVGKLFAEDVRRATRTVWWSSLRDLLEAAYQKPTADRDIYMSVLQGWVVFGAAMGLDEQRERKRHEREAAYRCARPGCVWHRTAPGGSVELKACQGCGEVRYCGQECQKSHWAEHKARCRRTSEIAEDEAV